MSIKAHNSSLVLTKTEILSQVSQETLFQFYLGLHPTKELVRNPLRVDKNPGCNFYRTEKGTIYFKDWAASKSWNCIDVVMDKHQCNYYQALKIITKDLSKIHELESLGQKSVSLNLEHQEALVQAISQPWDEAALSYWSDYGISLRTLDKYKVYNIKTVYINNILKFKATQNNPIFAYKVNNARLKVYRPLASTRQTKWRSNTRKFDLHGWDIVQEHPNNLVIFTSSVKDCMVLYELGYTAFCGTSESVTLSDYQKKFLKDNYPRILIFMDSDDPGIRENIKLSESLDSPFVIIPKKYHTKDISDFYKKFGKNKTRKLMKKLLSKAFRQQPRKYEDVPF